MPFRKYFSTCVITIHEIDNDVELKEEITLFALTKGDKIDLVIKSQ